MYNFDNEINRRGTNSLKWDALNERYGNPDLLPLWVADMDWETPHFIKDAITKQIADTPVLGYTITPPEYKSTIRKWILDHHQWDVKDEWLSFVPGIVKGIGMIINVFLKEDEKVIVQPPVYHPFFLTAQGNKREVVWNPLKPVYNNDGSLKTYEMDFDHLEKVCDDKCRLLILANPHNPCGIVWDKETLVRLFAPQILRLARSQRTERAYNVRTRCNHSSTKPRRAVAQGDACLSRRKHPLYRGFLPREHPVNKACASAGKLSCMARLPCAEPHPPRPRKAVYRQGRSCPQLRQNIRQARRGLHAPQRRLSEGNTPTGTQPTKSGYRRINT